MCLVSMLNLNKLEEKWQVLYLKTQELASWRKKVQDTFASHACKYFSGSHATLA